MHFAQDMSLLYILYIFVCMYTNIYNIYRSDMSCIQIYTIYIEVTCLARNACPSSTWPLVLRAYIYMCIHVYIYIQYIYKCMCICIYLLFVIAVLCLVRHALRNMHTGWRRPIRCLKLQVIFRKRATNCRALLQEMTCKDKAFYDSTPPYTSRTHGNSFCMCTNLYNSYMSTYTYVYIC